MSKHNDLDKDIKDLLNKSVKNVIVTLGDKGSILFNKELKLNINPYKVNAIDTTGAGDCFNGTFVGLLAQDYKVDEALNKASKASAISVTKEGASSSYPKLNEL